VIIDGGGLVSPLADEVLDALAGFAGHRKVAKLLTILTGLPSTAEPRWLAIFPDGAAVLEERFDDAVARAGKLR
jgi:hypothetical protein